MFLQHLLRQTSKSVIVMMLMDKCGPHGSDIFDPKGQVQLQALLPNCTAIHQPMGQGVIAAWKAEYHSLFLKELPSGIETVGQRRAENKKKKAGMKGMDEGYDPHMGDVSRLLEASWKKVSQATIASCWVKVKIFPSVSEADLSNEWRKKRCKTTMEAAAEVVLLFESLSVPGNEKALKESNLTAGPTSNQATVWRDIERDDEIQIALVNDIVAEEEESSFAETTLQKEAETDADDDGPTVHPCATIPPARQLSVISYGLEKLALNNNLPEVGMLLRRAKRASTDARKRRVTKEPRQKLITELFGKKQ